MKNLENYGVQEMNAEEMRKTDGGNLLADIGKAISDAVEAIGEAIGDAWDWLVGHSDNGKTVIKF